MGFEDVHPEEDGAIFWQPSNVALHLPGPLGGVHVRLLVMREAEPRGPHRVEDVLVDEEDRGGVERSRLVPRLPEVVGPALQSVSTASRHEGARIRPGHQRGERIGGVGDRTIRVLEAGPPRGEGVQVRRSRALVSVCTEVIRPEGVDGDQEDIPSRPLEDASLLRRRVRRRDEVVVPAPERPLERKQSGRDHDRAPQERGALEQDSPELLVAMQDVDRGRSYDDGPRDQDVAPDRDRARSVRRTDDEVGRRGPEHHDDEERRVERRVEPLEDRDVDEPRRDPDGHASGGQRPWRVERQTTHRDPYERERRERRREHERGAQPDVREVTSRRRTVRRDGGRDAEACAHDRRATTRDEPPESHHPHGEGERLEQRQRADVDLRVAESPRGVRLPGAREEESHALDHERERPSSNDSPDVTQEHAGSPSPRCRESRARARTGVVWTSHRRHST